MISDRFFLHQKEISADHSTPNHCCSHRYTVRMIKAGKLAKNLRKNYKVKISIYSRGDADITETAGIRQTIVSDILKSMEDEFQSGL